VAALTTAQVQNGLTTAQVAALTTAHAAALTSAQVQALSSTQVSALETRDVAALTTANVAALTTAQVQNGLTTAQVAALTTAQAAALTTAQVASGLTTAQVAALTTAHAAALTSAQVQALSSTQVSALETRDVAALTTANVAALTTAQIQNGLTTAQVAALTTVQLAALTTAQVAAGLTTSQLVALTTAQAAALTTAQLQALTSTQVAALETRDVAALRTSQVAALTTAQVQNGLTTTQVAALTTAQMVSLTTAQITALSTAQVAALGTRQAEALTSNQVAALTTDQIRHLTFGTPIVLDLNGDGISTKSINNGVQFDIFGVGEAVNTGWVAPEDGLLVLDRNGNGAVDGGAELFGIGTTLASGQRAANGYQALAELDTDQDGDVDGSDTDFAKLMVWVDANSDGVSTGGELQSLASLGITQLDLAASTDSTVDNGNLVGLVSGYTKADGSTGQMADVWFRTSMPTEAGAAAAADSTASSGTTPEVLAVAQPAVTADSPDLADERDAAPVLQAAAVEAADVEPLASQLAAFSIEEPVPVAPVLQATTQAASAAALVVDNQSLSTAVAGLTDALAAFGTNGGAMLQASGGLSGSASSAAMPEATRLPVSLASVVDVMKQFDANGQLNVSAPAAGVGATPVSLNTTASLFKAQTDILATGKG
jgi:trimeric autotransporter adhesin